MDKGLPRLLLVSQTFFLKRIQQSAARRPRIPERALPSRIQSSCIRHKQARKTVVSLAANRLAVIRLTLQILSKFDLSLNPN